VVTDDFKVKASVGSSQRIPSFTDLYVNQRPGNIGNPALKPENAWQYEVGFTYTKTNKQLNVSAFNRTINDFIDWTRLTTDEPYQPQNLADQQMQGFNIRYKHDMEIGTHQYFNYSISYQYLSPQQKEINNQIISKYTIESLKHQAIIGLNYTYSDFGVQWQNRYIKRELNKGYLVSDVKLTYQFTKFQIYTTATNLFNSTYKEVAAVPMPSRWFNLGLNVKF
jgi:vitamin B12 transporter